MPLSGSLPGRRLRSVWRRGGCRSLRQRLLLGIGLPLLLLQGGVFWLEYRLDRREELADMRQELTTLTRLSAARLDAELARLPTGKADPSRLGVGYLRQLLQDADFQPGELLLVSASGVLLASDDRPIPPGLRLAQLARQSGDPALEAATRAIARHQTGIVHLPRTRMDPQPRWLLFSPVRQTGGAVLALVRESVILAQLQGRLLRQSSIFVLGSLVILVWLAVLTALVTRPLVRLARATRQVAAGDWSVRIPGPFPRDEIGRVMGLFNRMLARLQASMNREMAATVARERVESELTVALRIQQSLLPSPFAADQPVAIASYYEPARFVAGDFYDYFLLDADTLVLAIADVSGKGISAALFMAAASTCLRNFSSPDLGPGATLAAVNRALARSNRESLFLTLFLAHVHLPSGRMTYANGGHNGPYLLRPDGSIQALEEPTGPLLAVFEAADYGERSLGLGSGESLVLYTDGVPEASDLTGALYGEARFETLLAGLANRSPEQITEAIAAAVHDYCQGPAQDDLTLLVLQRRCVGGDAG